MTCISFSLLNFMWPDILKWLFSVRWYFLIEFSIIWNWSLVVCTQQWFCFLSELFFELLAAVSQLGAASICDNEYSLWFLHCPQIFFSSKFIDVYRTHDVIWRAATMCTRYPTASFINISLFYTNPCANFIWRSAHFQFGYAAWIYFGVLSCRGGLTWWQLASRCCWNSVRPWLFPSWSG